LAVVAVGLAALAPAAGSSWNSTDLDPVFSPDGTSIAFVRTIRAGHGEMVGGGIMVVGADGHGLRILVPKVMATGLKWSPDGSSLVYAADGVLSIADVASGAVRQVTRMDEPPLGGASQPSWSPDGRVIAYTRGESCWRCTGIWLVGADGSNNHRLVLDGHRPVFSPDGTMLAISTGTSLLIALDGTQVLTASGSTAYTSWSPHGVYLSSTGSGLWLRNIATKRLRRLTTLVNSSPSWAPDGRVISGGAGQLVALTRVRDGRVFKRFAGSSINGGIPSWSPAGEVAFVREEGCGIDVAREDGTNRRRLTRTC
jgi:Tol biopolymer transport system component